MNWLESGGKQDPRDVRQDHIADLLQPAEAEHLGGLHLGSPTRFEAGALDLGQIGAGVERHADAARPRRTRAGCRASGSAK